MDLKTLKLMSNEKSPQMLWRLKICLFRQVINDELWNQVINDELWKDYL